MAAISIILFDGAIPAPRRDDLASRFSTTGQHIVTLPKDADPDIPILLQAKAEDAKLK